MEKKLSVIIPCYNHGGYLSDALASIDQSLYRDQVEVIIINDGSTDENTNNLINSLSSDKYVVVNQKNQGLACSRNNGISIAKAEYVLMLDADNYVNQVFISDFFEIRSKGIKFDALYGNAQCFGVNNSVMIQGEFDLFRILHRNYIDACAIFRKIKLFDIGLYDEKMPFMGWEDWDLWLRLAFSNSKIKHSDKTYFYYRVVENSMIRSHDKEAIKSTFEYVYKKHYININNTERIIENYINRSVSYKTLIQLALKKMKLNRNYKFKITKPEYWL